MARSPAPRRSNVRFGSKADICVAIRHVRFTPDNDRDSGFPHKVMSALPPKADISAEPNALQARPVQVNLRELPSGHSTNEIFSRREPK